MTTNTHPLDLIEVRRRAAEIVEAGTYEAAVHLMDDDIREELHSEHAGSITDLEFLTAYTRRDPTFPPTTGGAW